MRELDQCPGEQGVVEIPIGLLSTADSPRIWGESRSHIATLAASEVELPPIIVHRQSMSVIDGMHRLRVAQLRGQEKIKARFFHGSELDAFVLAVKSNVAHGLPLSLQERKLAAVRILQSRSEWSNRRIASVTGLSASSVGEIRKRLMPPGEAGPRIGQDGRVRPVDASRGRWLASELMTENPALSLRQVAKAVGISPETARDVRNRLRRGEDPVRGRAEDWHRRQERPRPPAKRGTGPDSPASPGKGKAIERLMADPALRHSESGRNLLRLLHIHSVKAEEWQKIAAHVPPHCALLVVHLAHECAQLWKMFAEDLERKTSQIA